MPRYPLSRKCVKSRRVTRSRGSTDRKLSNLSVRTTRNTRSGRGRYKNTSSKVGSRVKRKSTGHTRSRRQKQYRPYTVKLWGGSEDTTQNAVAADAAAGAGGVVLTPVPRNWSNLEHYVKVFLTELCSDDENIRSKAVKDLKSLTLPSEHQEEILGHVTDAKAKEAANKIIKAGGIESLQNAYPKGESDDSSEEVLVILANLTDDQTVKNQIAEFLEIYTDELCVSNWDSLTQRKQLEMVDNIVHLCHISTYSRDEEKNTTYTYVKKLVKQLDSAYQTDEQLLSSASNLRDIMTDEDSVFDHTVAKAITDHDGHISLIRLLTHKNEYLQTVAAETLARMLACKYFANPTEIKNIIVNNDGIEALNELLGSHNEQGKEYAAEALKYLSDTQEFCQKIRHDCGLQVLKGLAERNTGEKIVEYANAVIENMKAFGCYD